MKKVLLVVVAMILVGGLILSGCAAPSPAPAPAPGPSPAPAGIKTGGTLTVNFFRPASRFGVPLNIRHSDHWYAEHALEKLLTSSEAQAMTYDPQLATSWEMAPDRSSYTFHLREGVKFHDGTDFNAQAVKWNLDQVLAAKRPQLNKVSSIDVIDDYTIRFNLSGWDCLLLGEFGSDVGFIISPTAFNQNGVEWANTHPIGTGPWIMSDFVRNQHIKYKKNPDYWGQVPYLDELVVLHIQDPMTASAAFRKGEVDILYSIFPETAAELEATGQYVVDDSTSGPGGGFVMNTEDPNSIWYDKRMREALEYAIDKETIVEVLAHGYASPQYEIIKGIHEAGVDPGTVPRKYNPEKAKQLIKDAGYADGVKVKWTVNADGPQDTNVAIQAYLAEVGIEVELNPVTGAALNQMSFEAPLGNDLRQEAQRGGPANPLQGVKETLSETSIYLPGLKRPEGFQPLVEQALQETDMAKVLELCAQMDKLAYEDVMFVPMIGTKFVHIIQPYCKDVILLYGGGPHPKLQYCWLDK